MEISNIRVKNIGANVVFAHQIPIRMASSTEFGGSQPECLGSRILLSVRSMAIGTYGYVRVIDGQKRSAMHTPHVLGINGAVALAASGGNLVTRGTRFPHFVAAMAVRANGRIPVARRQDTGMHPESGLFCLFLVTGSAPLIIRKLKFPVVPGVIGRMREPGDVAMATRASQ